jgi:hypothetical protein
MTKRLQFQCWNCPETYYQDLATTTSIVRAGDLKEQTLLVTCPYCGAEAVVELGPYHDRTKSVLRGEEDDPGAEEFQLPDILPTHKPA